MTTPISPRDVARWLDSLIRRDQPSAEELELLATIADRAVVASGANQRLSQVLNVATEKAALLWQLVLHQAANGEILGDLKSIDCKAARVVLRPIGDDRVSVETAGLPDGLVITSIGLLAAPSNPPPVRVVLSPPDSWSEVVTPPGSSSQEGSLNAPPHSLAASDDSEKSVNIRYFDSCDGGIVATYSANDQLGRLIDLEFVVVDRYTGRYFVEIEVDPALSPISLNAAVNFPGDAQAISEAATDLAHDLGLAVPTIGRTWLLAERRCVFPEQFTLVLRPLTEEQLGDLIWQEDGKNAWEGLTVTDIAVHSSEGQALISRKEHESIFAKDIAPHRVGFVRLATQHNTRASSH